MGKDSTTLLWLCRKAFMGDMPFPVIYIDTNDHFQEMYEFRDKYAEEWDLDLIVAKNEEAIERGIHCGMDEELTCCKHLKTIALQNLMEERNFDGLLVGIRRDEHGIRAKERYFSPRSEDFTWDYEDQPPEIWTHFSADMEPGEHFRVHPLLQWTELDIWRYIKRENIPTNSLYFSQGGERYRSLGCEPTTSPIDSDADSLDEIIEELKKTEIAERSGRPQDKESGYTMQKLRALGYM